MKKTILISLIVYISLLTSCKKEDSDIITVDIENTTQTDISGSKIYAYYRKAVTDSDSSYVEKILTDSLSIDTISGENTKSISWSPELTSSGSGAFSFKSGDLTTSFGYNEGSSMYEKTFKLVVYNDSIVCETEE